MRATRRLGVAVVVLGLGACRVAHPPREAANLPPTPEPQPSSEDVAAYLSYERWYGAIARGSEALDEGDFKGAESVFAKALGDALGQDSNEQRRMSRVATASLCLARSLLEQAAFARASDAMKLAAGAAARCQPATILEPLFHQSLARVVFVGASLARAGLAKQGDLRARASLEAAKLVSLFDPTSRLLGLPAELVRRGHESVPGWDTEAHCAEAERLLSAVDGLSRAAHDPWCDLLPEAHETRARICAWRGQFVECDVWYALAISEGKECWGSSDSRVAQVYLAWGEVYAANAFRLWKVFTSEMAASVSSDLQDHMNHSGSVQELEATLARSRDAEQKLAVRYRTTRSASRESAVKARYPLEQALKIQRDALGAHDTNTLFTMELLAQAMIDALQFGEADRYLDELRAIAASPDLPSDERRKVSNMLDALGTVRDGRMALNSRYGERGS